MPYQTVDPYTGELVTSYAYATDPEIDATIEKAHVAFLGWRTTAAGDRSKILARAAELLRVDKRAFAEVLTQELGKIIAEAETEVELSAEILDYFADHGARFLEAEPLAVKDPSEGTVTIVHEPLGVIYAIEPWNFPYYQVIRVAAAQILAGNTIVLKHAENVPASALAMQKLFDDAGLPDGVFCNLFAPISSTEHILSHPLVRGVALTGGERAGTHWAGMPRPPRSSPDKRTRIVMAETVQFTIGADAGCSDGDGGKVTRVVIDPGTRTVTHLVVEPRHRQGLGRLVPLSLVDAAAGEIRLRCTTDEFEKLDSAEETQFVPGTSGYASYGPEQVLSWPYYGLGPAGMGGSLGAGSIGSGIDTESVSRTVTYDKVPLGEVTVRRGEQVQATDGGIGCVEGLVIDPRDRHVTHVLLQEGHLWGRKEVAIPIGAVAGADDGIRLNLTKQEVRDLPPVDVDRT